MTEVTPNLPHCGNFCKYCFMGTLLFVSDVFVGADSGAETGAKTAGMRTETRHEKMEYFLCTSEIFAVS
mgnify:CR=1 FL=1